MVLDVVIWGFSVGIVSVGHSSYVKNTIVGISPNLMNLRNFWGRGEGVQTHSQFRIGNPLLLEHHHAQRRQIEQK